MEASVTVLPECRVCLGVENLLHSLFDVYEEKYFLPQIIFDCIGLEIKNDDDLPLSICVPCAVQLVEFNTFRNLFLETDRKLRERWDVEYLTKEVEDDDEEHTLEDTEELTEVTEDQAEYYLSGDDENDGPKIIHTFEDDTLAEIEVLADADVVDVNLVESYLIQAVETDEKALYKCDHCEKSFPSMASLRTHNYIHNQGQYKCEICPNKVLTTPGFLRLHMEKIHNVFAAKDGLDEVATSPSKNKKNLCKICNRYFSKIGIVSHMRSHKSNQLTSTTDGKKVLKCPLCLLTFSCRRNVQRHMKRVHPEGKQEQPAIFTCDLCPQSFQIVVQLYEHYKTHDETCEETVEGFNLNCDDCAVQLRTYEEYAKHVIEAHQHEKVKPYKCRLCEARHGTRVALYMHINCHFVVTSETDETVIVKAPNRKRVAQQRCLCPVCGNDFCTRQILKQHMLIHIGLKPYACDFCDKFFRSKSALKEHIRVHTDERPYKCSVCDKGFRSHSNLRNHRISSHSDVKKHSCNVCGKSFKFNGNLRSHLWTHSDGEKPYNCVRCNVGFRRLGKLKAHLQVCS